MEIRHSYLMDKLRSQSSKRNSLLELSKMVRSALLDRRFSLDSVDKGILLYALDSLTDQIRVRSANDMALRLEGIARKLGLKFMGAPVHGCFYLSTEMFYMEINIDSNGVFKEAKIHHIDASNAQPALSENVPQLHACLSKGDFSSVRHHLEGLLDVYNLKDVSTTDKSRAWTLLTQLEEDLEYLSSSAKNWKVENDVVSYICSSPLGHVTPRVGGLPLSLRYFIAPIELLDVSKKSFRSLTLEEITEENLGQSLSLSLEKVERARLYTLRSSNSTSTPSTSSLALPIQTVLKLSRSLLISLSNVRKIERITNIPMNSLKFEPLLSLLTFPSQGEEEEEEEMMKKNKKRKRKSYIVDLLDQVHEYNLTDFESLQGTRISSIPFEKSGNVSFILEVLRQQVVFNTLVTSLKRQRKIGMMEPCDTKNIEISFLDHSRFSVFFEHPRNESLSVLNVDVSNILKVRTTLNSSSTPSLEEPLNRVLQKFLSFPILMRSLFKFLSTTRPKEEENIMSGVSVPYSTNENESFKVEETDETNTALSTKGESFQEFKSIGKLESLNGYGPQGVVFYPGAELTGASVPSPTTTQQQRLSKKHKSFASPSSSTSPSLHSSPSPSMNDVSASKQIKMLSHFDLCEEEDSRRFLKRKKDKIKRRRSFDGNEKKGKGKNVNSSLESSSSSSSLTQNENSFKDSRLFHRSGDLESPSLDFKMTIKSSKGSKIGKSSKGSSASYKSSSSSSSSSNSNKSTLMSSSSSGSSKNKVKGREKEEKEKKELEALLAGGKLLNSSFQIPKLKNDETIKRGFTNSTTSGSGSSGHRSKSSSPQASSFSLSKKSPKYIGGGSGVGGGNSSPNDKKKLTKSPALTPMSSPRSDFEDSAHLESSSSLILGK